MTLTHTSVTLHHEEMTTESNLQVQWIEEQYEIAAFKVTQ